MYVSKLTGKNRSIRLAERIGTMQVCLGVKERQEKSEDERLIFSAGVPGLVTISNDAKQLWL